MTLPATAQPPSPADVRRQTLRALRSAAAVGVAVHACLVRGCLGLAVYVAESAAADEAWQAVVEGTVREALSHPSLLEQQAEDAAAGGAVAAGGAGAAADGGGEASGSGSEADDALEGECWGGAGWVLAGWAHLGLGSWRGAAAGRGRVWRQRQHV